MTDVIVSALYIWLAVTAIAMVVWFVSRVRERRTLKAARQTQAVDTLASEGTAPTQTTINLRKAADTPTVADATRQMAGAKATSGAAAAGAATAAGASAATSATGSASKLATHQVSAPDAKPPTRPATEPSEAAKKPSKVAVKPSEPKAKPTGGLFARRDNPSTTPPPARHVDPRDVDARDVDIDLVDPPASTTEATTTKATTTKATTTKATTTKATTTEATPASAPQVADNRRTSLPVEKSLADLVAGITLPHDLTPLISDDPEVAAIAVTLVSISQSAGEIGGSFADELERLGYAIFSLSDSEAVAQRPAADGGDDEVMSLAIRTDVSPLGSSTVGGTAVAIDLWLGAEDCPLPAE